MPRTKVNKKVEAAEPVMEPVAAQPEAVSAPQENPNVSVVEINGRRYNKIFNPADGTTSVELLTE